MARSLVIQLARFGDLVQTGRLIRSLADRGDEIHILVDRSLATLARLLYPDAVVHAAAAHGGQESEPGAFLAQNRRSFAALAEASINRVYNLNFSGLNAAVTALFDAESVRGYRYYQGQLLRDAWPRLAMRWTRNRRSTGLNVVDFWAAFAEGMAAPGDVNPVAASRGGGIGVVLAGRHSRRTLPPDVLAPVLTAIFERLGGPPVTLLGSVAEKPAARALARELKPRIFDRTRDLAGATDWAGLLEVVGGLDVLLTPDTGTMHLAARLGTPVLAFFLSSAWLFETGPYGEGHTVWQAAAPCVPCLEARQCPVDTACLAPFRSPAFLRLLAGGGGEGPPDLTGYRSRLDGLGATYAPFTGLDPFEDARNRYRSFLARHLAARGAQADESSLGADLADVLYAERDWLLPDLP